jgi:hypothetical protein
LLEKLVIGAIARTNGRPINWGAGGPECWPRTRPYFTPENGEDHKGFRIIDWYNAFVQSVLVTPRPTFLFEVGGPVEEDPGHKNHTILHKTIISLLDGEKIPGAQPLPSNVIGSAFWLLSATEGSSDNGQAWYKTPNEYLPIVDAVRNRRGIAKNGSKSVSTIAHYLLLPSFAGEISDVHLDLIRPFVKKYQPTIGFSLQEARQAERVTVIGGNGSYPQDEINQLRNSGCVVQQIEGHGIDIASFMTS